MVIYILFVWTILGPALSQTILSECDKETLLNEHNRLRGLVRPTAANMRRMVRQHFI